MKTKKMALIIMMFIGTILFTAQSAIAGCEIPFLDEFVVEKKAPGTKYNGTLALYFGNPDLYIFARIEKKKVLHSFAEIIPDITHLQFINDPELVGTFFTDNVIPYLYNCDPNYDEQVSGNNCDNVLYPNSCFACPDVALKSYDNDVSHGNPGTFDYPVYLQNSYEFYILDIEIAADD